MGSPVGNMLCAEMPHHHHHPVFTLKFNNFVVYSLFYRSFEVQAKALIFICRHNNFYLYQEHLFYMTFFCSETKLQKEHDIAVSKLSDRQRKFQIRLNDVLDIVKGFKTKDRMSEAQDYLLKLKEIQRVLEGFYKEVSWLSDLFVLPHIVFSKL